MSSSESDEALLSCLDSLRLLIAQTPADRPDCGLLIPLVSYRLIHSGNPLCSYLKAFLEVFERGL